MLLYLLLCCFAVHFQDPAACLVKTGLGRWNEIQEAEEKNGEVAENASYTVQEQNRRAFLYCASIPVCDTPENPPLCMRIKCWLLPSFAAIVRISMLLDEAPKLWSDSIFWVCRPAVLLWSSLHIRVFVWSTFRADMLICLKSNKVEHNYTYAYCPSVPILINVSYVQCGPASATQLQPFLVEPTRSANVSPFWDWLQQTCA